MKRTNLITHTQEMLCRHFQRARKIANLKLKQRIKHVVIATGLLYSIHADAGVALTGLTIIRTPNYESNSGLHSDYWVNTLGTIYVFSTRVFMGAYSDIPLDFPCNVIDVTNGNILFMGSWDHYSNATGFDACNPEERYSPNYIVINPGDVISVNINPQTGPGWWFNLNRFMDDARTIPDPTYKPAQVGYKTLACTAVTIWYSTIKP